MSVCLTIHELCPVRDETMHLPVCSWAALQRARLHADGLPFMAALHERYLANVEVQGLLAQVASAQPEATANAAMVA